MTCAQFASADEFARTFIDGIDEREAVGEKLQRPREVVGRYVNDVGIERIVDHRKAQRRHVHAQLVCAPSPRVQPVQAVAEVLDERLGVRLTRLLDGLPLPAPFDDSAAHQPR